MKPDINPNKIVILSGAGISAESGLATFRDSDGLWCQYRIEDVASPEGWQRDPALVLDFYNQRRRDAAQAQPNRAHLALAELEQHYEVVIITQNVDDLHERAGSTHVLHVHGELRYGRSSQTEDHRRFLGDQPIQIGDLADDGSQLRPDIVWFDEHVRFFDDAREHIKTASKVMVVGTSLTVFPVASLVHAARGRAEKILITQQIDRVPYGFRLLRGQASGLVAAVVQDWVSMRR